MTAIAVSDKTYDELDLPDSAVQLSLRCRHCGLTNTLVENTMVPRSMAADLYLLPDEEGGGYVVNLLTGDDDAFWEAEIGHQWGCRTCTAENTDINEVFEVIPDDS